MTRFTADDEAYWRERFVAEPELETAVACGRWVYSHVAHACQRDVAESWALQFGRLTAAELGPDPLFETAHYLARSTDQPEAEFARLYQASRAHHAGRFADVYALVLAGRQEHDLQYPLEEALFAAAVLGSPRWDRAYAREVAEEAWARRGTSTAGLDVLLDGLGEAAPFPGHATMLTTWVSHAVREHPDQERYHRLRRRIA